MRCSYEVLSKVHRGVAAAGEMTRTPELKPIGSSAWWVGAAMEDDASQISLDAIGRRGTCRLGFLDGKPCAVKRYATEHLRGDPPPAHCNVNQVLQRSCKGNVCIELRELCVGCLLYTSPSPRDS